MNVQPFSPVGSCRLVAPTITSSSTTLPSAEAAAECIRIYNAGTQAVAVKFSIGAATAVYPAPTGDTVLAPGGIEVFSKGVCDTVSLVAASGTGSVFFQCGQGQ